MIKSRFSSNYIFPLLGVFVVSFVLSLFLLQVIGGIIFIFWLFEKWDEKKKIVDILTVSVIIFGIIRLISIFFSAFPSNSYESLYKEALFYFALVFMCFYLKTLDKKTLLRLVLIFIIGAAVMSIVGITRFVLGNVDRAKAFSSGYAVFSSYLMVALSLTLFYPRGFQNSKSWIYWSVIILILFFGILSSLGRTNILIAILLIITSVVLKKINWKQLLLLSTFLAALSIIYFYLPAKQIENKFESRIENFTQLSDRDIIWKGAKEILFEKPILGFGPRTFEKIFPLRDQFADKNIGGWHNDFLQIYFESGLVGLLSFIGLLIFSLGVSIKQIRNKKIDADLRKLSTSILVALIALILSAITAGFITSVVLSIVFVFLISILSRIEVEKINIVNESNAFVG
jgi:O-antigen ligase